MIEVELEERERSWFDCLFFIFFISCVGRHLWVRESTNDKYVVSRERTVAESLINLRGVVSSRRISVANFGGGVLYRNRIKGGGGGIFICLLWDALLAQTIFWTGAFFFSLGGYCGGSGRHEGC